MRIPQAVRHPIETLKTAPVGFTGVAISVGFLGLGAASLYEHIADEHENSVVKEIGNIAGDAVLVGLGFRIGQTSLGMVGHSFEHRKRMEKVLQREGFNERVMTHTLELYCERQATLIACDQFDVRDEYLTLIKNTDPNDMVNSWIPHF